MNLSIKSKNTAALKVLGGQLKNTGFANIKTSDNEITIPSIGRKSLNYIKKVVKNFDGIKVEDLKHINI